MDVQNAVEFILQSQTTQESNIGKLIEAQRKNEAMLARVLESIDSLARIAHAHEQRISGLEGGRA